MCILYFLANTLIYEQFNIILVYLNICIDICHTQDYFLNIMVLIMHLLSIKILMLSPNKKTLQM